MNISRPIIILTQTFVDTNFLERLIAWGFFELKKINLTSSIDKDLADKLFLHFQSSNQIISKDFDQKTDFLNSLSELHVNYPLKTLLFLGNLDKYSELLQEGMLRLLEEPPKNLQIILFAKNRSQILETVASRCLIKGLSLEHVLKNLDQKLLSKVEKIFPKARDYALALINKKPLLFPDFNKIEREEMDFFLWQVEIYLEQIYKQNSDLKVAKAVAKVLETRNLNDENLQKKLAFAWLKTE